MNSAESAPIAEVLAGIAQPDPAPIEQRIDDKYAMARPRRESGAKLVAISSAIENTEPATAAPADAVENALASALDGATKAGRWDVVALESSKRVVRPGRVSCGSTSSGPRRSAAKSVSTGRPFSP